MIVIHKQEGTTATIYFQPLLSNTNVLIISLLMTLYLFMIGYYMKLLTQSIINKLILQRQLITNTNNNEPACIDDNSPQSVNHHEIITTPEIIITTTCDCISTSTVEPNEQVELNIHSALTPINNVNTSSPAAEQQEEEYIHPDLVSPTTEEQPKEQTFPESNIRAESLLTIFNILVQRVMDIEKEWTRIIASQLESRLSYHDSSDSSCSDEYYENSRGNIQNVRMRRTQPVLRKMNSFQFPRAINFAL